MITRHGSPFGNCGWGSPGLDYDKINKEAEKAKRKLAFEARAKKLQKNLNATGEFTGILVCRQILKELGARKVDALCKKCRDSIDEDARYEELKDLARAYQ